MGLGPRAWENMDIGRVIPPYSNCPERGCIKGLS